MFVRSRTASQRDAPSCGATRSRHHSATSRIWTSTSSCEGCCESAATTAGPSLCAAAFSRSSARRCVHQASVPTCSSGIRRSDETAASAATVGSFSPRTAGEAMARRARGGPRGDAEMRSYGLTRCNELELECITLSHEVPNEHVGRAPTTPALLPAPPPSLSASRRRAILAFQAVPPSRSTFPSLACRA